MTLKNIIESLIFASGNGISIAELNDGFQGEYSEEEIAKALADLKKTYSGERGIHLIRFQDTYQFQTNVTYGEIISDMLKATKEKELSKTLLQVLAIIAYKQPVTKLDVEDLRGASSDYVFAMLLKLNLIEPVGHRDTLGHPVIYGTTDEFLKKFGLTSLDELPNYEQLLLTIRNNFDKYYAKSDDLYRERNVLSEEVASANADADAAEMPTEGGEEIELEDELPEFLDGEDVIEVD